MGRSDPELITNIMPTILLSNYYVLEHFCPCINPPPNHAIKVGITIPSSAVQLEN